MQISSRFTMAIHMFACIDTFSDQRMTSDFMAASIGTNPVIVRKILQQLKAAGLIEVARGTGGVTITRPLEQITFLDVYKAVECAPDEELFHFHENPNQKCPVGKNIHHVLDKRLLEVQKAMEEKLSEMTLADVKKDIAVYTDKEQHTDGFGCVIISSQFPKPFLFVVFNVKLLKEVVTKKVTKSSM